MSWWVENAPLVTWMLITVIVIVPLLIVLWKLWGMTSPRTEFLSIIIYHIILPTSMTVILVMFIGIGVMQLPSWWMAGNIAIYTSVFFFIGIVQIKKSGVIEMMRVERLNEKSGECFFAGRARERGGAREATGEDVSGM